jgi:hypothetical protein
MQDKFTSFLKKLENSDNKSLLEAVSKGYQCIMEGYADVRDEVDEVDTLSQFNNMAVREASMQGNNVLAFLDQSGKQNASRFSVDTDEELDGNPTNDFNGAVIFTPEVEEELQIDASSHNTMKSFEDNLGLTPKDLQDLL